MSENTSTAVQSFETIEGAIREAYEVDGAQTALDLAMQLVKEREWALTEAAALEADSYGYGYKEKAERIFEAVGFTTRPLPEPEPEAEAPAEEATEEDGVAGQIAALVRSVSEVAQTVTKLVNAAERNGIRI